MTAIPYGFCTAVGVFTGAVAVIAWYVIGAFMVVVLIMLLPDQGIVDWTLRTVFLVLGLLALYLGGRAATAFAQGMYGPRWLAMASYLVSFTFFALLPVLFVLAWHPVIV
jgi:hypothetical protein